MEVVIVSKEMVKPSSPSPHHIYTYSLLDLANDPTFLPSTLYYLPEAADSDCSKKIHILKESLSINLNRFYPFAGRIKDDFSVDCRDGGVPFSVAKVRGTNLQDFLRQPDLQMTMKFLPNQNSRQVSKPGDHISEFQVNCFECGGLAISVVVSHKVADAGTACTFLRAWAAVARSSSEQIYPEFIGQTLFPPTGVMDSESKLFTPEFSTFLRFTKYAIRRYVFDASFIAKLKERARSDGPVTSHPTSVEVVSAFIWKRYMNVFTKKPDLEKPFILMQPVSMRRRADPPLPDESFGNFFWFTVAQCTNPTDANFKDLASKVKRAIEKIDGGFVKALQNNGYHEKLEETKKWFQGGPNFMAISSLCKSGWYDTDFGWDKPVWISLFVCGDSESFAANGASFMDTRFGDGIEAWTTLAQDYVTAFEEDEDMQNHVLVNPSPLPLSKSM